MSAKRILIVVGSASDLPSFDDGIDLLKRFKIGHDVRILSAHRSPKLVVDQIEKLPRSYNVIIAGAGGAAHLAGVIAAHTLLPVIGVPMPSTLKGLDSFVSTSQMPAGIPVSTMSIGKAGGTNSVLMAAQILALHDKALAKRLATYRKSLVTRIRKANRALKKRQRR